MSGVDPPPKNAIGDFVLEPKLKTRHEGDPVTSGEQVRLRIGPEGSHAFLNGMRDGMKEDSDFREVNAIPYGNDTHADYVGTAPNGMRTFAESTSHSGPIGSEEVRHVCAHFPLPFVRFSRSRFTLPV
jgi:hypothetical protein